MRRKAFIISNPGEQGAENYCQGVLRDIEHYQSFLRSAIGGFWQPSEIEAISRPSVADLRSKMAVLSAVNYALVVFTGHGWYSSSLDSTVLELRKGQEIDSAELRSAMKETLILDCCREIYPGRPEARALDEMVTKAAPRLDPEECRRYYNKQIEECRNEVLVLHSCSPGETSGDDDQRGGVYSYSLLQASKDWADQPNRDVSKTYYWRSVASAHEDAVKRVARLRSRQSPRIEKPRSAPYFPLCVVA